MSEIRAVEEALRGTPAAIPANLPDRLSDKHEMRDDDLRYAVQVIGLASRTANQWVAVHIPHTCFALGIVHEATLIQDWKGWHGTNHGLPPVRGFRKAVKAGLVTIDEDGYASPTQRLANILCGLEP